jgi:hypothetical protein
MTYSTPELLFVGAARNIVLGESASSQKPNPIDGCVEVDQPGLNEEEAW